MKRTNIRSFVLVQRNGKCSLQEGYTPSKNENFVRRYGRMFRKGDVEGSCRLTSAREEEVQSY